MAAGGCRVAGCDFAVGTWGGRYMGPYMAVPGKGGQAETERLGQASPISLGCFSEMLPYVGSFLTFLLFGLWNPFSQQNFP